jgi:outer membrane protein OmpA-like peptidoglycan-associated protein
MTDKKEKTPYSFTAKEIREHSANYSDKVSTINRSLALTGIAISWLFLYQSASNQYQLKWLFPIGIFILATAIDLNQYGYAFRLFHDTDLNSKPDAEGFHVIPAVKVDEIYRNYKFKMGLTVIGYLLIFVFFLFGLPSKSVKITGTVLQENTEAPIASTVRIFSLPQKEPVSTLITDTSANGSYRFKLPEKGQYLLSVEADSFFRFSEVIDADSISRSGDKYLYKTIFLKPIGFGVPQQLDEVYFEFNKANLLPASYESLNKLVKLLKENLFLRIKIDAHTDNIGTAESNKRLSDARAEAVKRHLTNSGIATQRILTEGFGEEKPIADNRTEYGKSSNRRVEFTLLK